MPIESMKIDQAFWSKKRVFVTGHTGFKGAWLIAILNRLGAQTAGYSLAPPTDRPSLYTSGIKPTTVDQIGDIRDAATLKKTLTHFEPELVFHLAAQPLVLKSYEDPAETFETNVMGTVNVLLQSLETKARVVLNVTSDKCYENLERQAPYTESDAMGGHDPYSASKGAAELVASSLRRSFFNERGVGLPSVRAGNVIGGGDWADQRIIPDLARAFSKGQPAILRNPLSIRPWQHVLEPLRAYLLLAQVSANDPLKYSGGWNVGPNFEDARTVEDLAKLAASTWGETAKLTIEKNPEQSIEQKKEATYLKLDSAKLRDALGWQPILDFESSVRLTIDWYKRFAAREDGAAVCREQVEAYLKLDSQA